MKVKGKTSLPSTEGPALLLGVVTSASSQPLPPISLNARFEEDGSFPAYN